MRGHYFAIATLGLGIVAGEIASGWEYVGAGSGMVTPLYPGHIDGRNLFLGYLFFALAAVTFLCLKWLYGTRFGLMINAVRDNEDKAEAMGLRTGTFESLFWCVSAVLLALCGGALGNLLSFVDPRDAAFAGPTFGVWIGSDGHPWRQGNTVGSRARRRRVSRHPGNSGPVFWVGSVLRLACSLSSSSAFSRSAFWVGRASDGRIGSVIGSKRH